MKTFDQITGLCKFYSKQCKKEKKSLIFYRTSKKDYHAFIELQKEEQCGFPPLRNPICEVELHGGHSEANPEELDERDDPHSEHKTQETTNS